MQLEERVTRLEEGVYRGGVLATGAALVLSLLLPYLAPSAEVEDEEPVSLLGAVSGIADAGDGPFQGQAVLAAAAVGLLALVTVLNLVVVALSWSNDLRERVRTPLKVLSGVLIAGCVGGWLLVLLLNSHSEGDVDPLSPAMITLTVGAAGTQLLRAFDRYRVHHA